MKMQGMNVGGVTVTKTFQTKYLVQALGEKEVIEIYRKYRKCMKKRRVAAVISEQDREVFQNYKEGKIDEDTGAKILNLSIKSFLQKMGTMVREEHKPNTLAL